MNKNYLIVDFNPDRVKKLNSRGIKCIYGDVSNVDFIEELRLDKAKLIVSTIPETENNLMLLDKIRKKNKKAIIIVTAKQISDTYNLYKRGANYVILPHFLGGEYTARLIEKAGENKSAYEIEKNKQLKELKERLKEGQEHPATEKEHK